MKSFLFLWLHIFDSIAFFSFLWMIISCCRTHFNNFFQCHNNPEWSVLYSKLLVFQLIKSKIPGEWTVYLCAKEDTMYDRTVSNNAKKNGQFFILFAWKLCETETSLFITFLEVKHLTFKCEFIKFSSSICFEFVPIFSIFIHFTNLTTNPNISNPMAQLPTLT